jgi:glycosyltransferase involved in cell wall biosynthesis
MQEVVKQISERLVKLGHQVTVATRKMEGRNSRNINGVTIQEFDVSGNKVIGYKGSDVQSYQEYLLKSDFDVITFFAAQQWATDLALEILPQIRAMKVSVPTGYSGLYIEEYKTYFREMEEYIHHYDMNVYLSDDYRDINFARLNGVNRIILIPNGASEEEFLAEKKFDVREELSIPDDYFLILHVGSYTGVKGHEEAIRIVLESDHSNIALLMIGNGFENFHLSRKIRLRLFFNKLFGRKKIVYGYFDRKFTVDAYRQSDLFLFPSRIECSPIVLFECAAAGLPFLSNDVGNAVEIASWTEGGEIIPTLKGIDGYSHSNVNSAARRLDEFILNKVKLKRMGSLAHEMWKEKYTWEKIAEQYENMYYSILEKKTKIFVK